MLAELMFTAQISNRMFTLTAQVSNMRMFTAKTLNTKKDIEIKCQSYELLNRHKQNKKELKEVESETND